MRVFGANPFTAAPRPIQRHCAFYDRIMNFAKIEVIVQIEFVMAFDEVNAVFERKILFHAY
jgi:hypothetical protein